MQSIPIIAQHEPAIFPPKLTGILSPYPTVVIVINDHHIPSGIDLICLALLSSEIILIQLLWPSNWKMPYLYRDSKQTNQRLLPKPFET